MPGVDLLLFPVFNELRKLDVPLGVPEYLLAVKTIREGMGLADVSSLKRLCRLLWAKSQEDQKKFDVVFARIVEAHLQPAQMPHLSVPPISTKNSLEETADKQDLRTTFRLLPLDALSESAESPLQSMKFHLTPRLPMDRREIATIWRQLRKPLRQGPLEELDVEGTIDALCRTGFFLGPTLQPRRRNQVKLILMVDQLGSMAPFSFLVEALTESVLHRGFFGDTHIYYFHDCPEDIIYEQPVLAISRSLDDVLSEHAKGASVLIVSDAGAARGHYDGWRFSQTRSFIQSLSKYTYLYAWLNPEPLNRWKATTAEDIAGIIPMYHLNREGLSDAIGILRGHPFPLGVTIDGRRD